MAEKTLVLKEVIDLYPRMLGLLKAADLSMAHYFYAKKGSPQQHNFAECTKCQIQALLKQAEGE